MATRGTRARPPAGTGPARAPGGPRPGGGVFARRVAPAEQPGAEVDDVDDAVRRRSGEALDDQLGGGPGAGAGLGGADDGDGAHADHPAAAASCLATSSRTSGMTWRPTSMASPRRS